MSRIRLSGLATALIAVVLGAILLSPPAGPSVVSAQGVGRASWTPSTSTTVPISSRFLVADDSITYQTKAAWSRRQAQNLKDYVDSGLRYTHEINDRSGRLSATGYWATNHPDPAYDRDDDDGDGRWEEAEITAGTAVPEADATYTALIQFSRWHGKRQHGKCTWAWDRRLGSTEVLSQLSRDLLGEWQAERFTLTYQTLPFARLGSRPPIPASAPPARCRERRPRPDQSGVLVTFEKPLPWPAFMELQARGAGRWTAFEAIGSSPGDARPWTCGGPIEVTLGLRPCRDMGMKPDGVSAAVGYYDEASIAALRSDSSVSRVDGLRDALTGLLFDVGGFGVERPDLTIDDSYWELHFAD